MLALLVWQSGRVGPWVLAIGLMRYVFVLASWYLPALRGPLPPSRRRQAVCVQQSVTLLVCLLPPVGNLFANVSAGLALLALLASFASDIIYLVRIRRSPTAIGAVDRLRDGAIVLSAPDRRDPQMCRTRTVRKVLEEISLSQSRQRDVTVSMVAVDRAASELRRNSAVIIDDERGAVLAQAAETVTAESVAALLRLSNGICTWRSRRAEQACSSSSERPQAS